MGMSIKLKSVCTSVLPFPFLLMPADTAKSKCLIDDVMFVRDKNMFFKQILIIQEPDVTHKLKMYLVFNEE